MKRERNDQSEKDQPIGRGVERLQGYSEKYLQSAETSAYCIGYANPNLYAEALASAGGDATAVEPSAEWDTEDAVSLAAAEQLALTRWREWKEWGVTITIYERVDYRLIPNPDPERAAAGETDCAWDDIRAIAQVGVDGQLIRVPTLSTLPTANGWPGDAVANTVTPQ